MRALLGFATLVLCGGAAASPQGEPESPLTVPHILNLPVLEGFDLSPDGKQVVVSASRLGKQNLWIVSAPHELGTQLTPSEEGRDADPAWSPDGRTIAFASDRRGRWHLFTASPGDEAPRQLTGAGSEDRLPRWSPDRRAIAYRSRWPESETGWDVWVVAAAGDASPRQLTRHDADEEDPRWSPDGKWIAYTYGGGRHQDRRIGVVASDGGAEPRDLLPEGWDGDSHSPRWSPDGKQIAFVSNHGGRNAIFAAPLEGGEPRAIVASAHEQTEPAWSPDGNSIAHVSNETGNMKLMLTNLAGEETRLLALGAGVYAEPRFSPEGDAVVSFYEGPTYPRDVWRFEKIGGRQRLTETLFPDLDVRQMIRPELVSWESFDGRTITGFLYLPAGASAEAPAPLIVHPHGGPTSQWKNGWHPFVQFLAQQGYAVLHPNVRGSSGFGLDFENLNDGDWGRGDLEDLVIGTRTLVGRPEIRDDRVGIWGVSYGGFLVLSAIGRYPDLFACAVESVGMPDLEALYRETNEDGRSYLEREIGPLRGNLQLYRDLSPIRHVDEVKTPLLSFHGQRYPLVPYSTKKPYMDALRKRRFPLLEYVFRGDFARATYRLDVYPGPSRFYLEKLMEFFELYL